MAAVFIQKKKKKKIRAKFPWFYLNPFAQSVENTAGRRIFEMENVTDVRFYKQASVVVRPAGQSAESRQIPVDLCVFIARRVRGHG